MIRKDLLSDLKFNRKLKIESNSLWNRAQGIVIHGVKMFLL